MPLWGPSQQQAFAPISAPGTGPQGGLTPVQVAMSPFRSIRNQGAARNIDVHHWGNSIASSFIANPPQLGYGQLIRAYLAAANGLGIPVAADFYHPAYAQFWPGAALTGPTPWLIPGDAVNLQGYGFGYVIDLNSTTLVRTSNADAQILINQNQVVLSNNIALTFTLGDQVVGATISIPGAGPAGATLVSTIIQYNNSTHVNIANNASVTVTNATVTVTDPYLCTFDSQNESYGLVSNADLHVIENNNGTFHYNVNGGPDQTKTVANGRLFTIVQTGLSNIAGGVGGGLQFIITSQTVAQTCLVAGMTIYPGARNANGLRYARFWQSGQLAAAIDGQLGALHPSPMWSSAIGVAANFTAGAPTTFPFTGADLVIWELGVNDMQGSVTQANYLTAISNCFNAYLSVKPAAFIIVIPNVPDPTYGEVTPYPGGGFNHAANWRTTFKPALYQIAAAYGAVVVDVDQDWGNKGVSLGYIGQTQNHPNNAGHARIAQLIESVLSS